MSQKTILSANIDELLLYRLDQFSMYGRNLLQLCAVLGFEFSLSQIIAIQCRGTEKKRKNEKIQILDILTKADSEQILLQSHGGSSMKRLNKNSNGRTLERKPTSDSHSDDEIFYTFTHAIWRNCILTTMLKKRKKSFHLHIAKSLEIFLPESITAGDLSFAIKLFGHWKNGAHYLKTTLLARKIGAYLDTELLVGESVGVCVDAIEMWKDTPTDSGDACRVAGNFKS